MKNIILGLGLMIGLMAFSSTLHAQVRIGIMSGIAPTHIDAGETVVANIDDTTRYSITDARASWHVGPFVRLQTQNLYLKAAALGAYSTLVYTKAPASDPTAPSIQAQEDNYQIDVPLSVGFSYERFFSDFGVIFSQQIRPEEANLFSQNPFKDLFTRQKMGYKACVGIDLDRNLSVEVNYAYYPDVTDRIMIDNTIDYTFQVRPHYVMVNFSWNFNTRNWY